MAGPSGLAVNIWRVGEEYWVAGVAVGHSGGDREGMMAGLAMVGGGRLFVCI
jgi:hypothetical protein